MEVPYEFSGEEWAELARNETKDLDSSCYRVVSRTEILVVEPCWQMLEYQLMSC